MLAQIEKDIAGQASANSVSLPRILDMQAVAPRSPGEFFRAVYDAAVQDCGAPPGAFEHYQGFLAAMDRAKSSLEVRYGANWTVVLLIDEMESAIQRLPDSECLENLRNLLMMSRFKIHFRAVVAGVFSPAEMTSKGSPQRDEGHRSPDHDKPRRAILGREDGPLAMPDSGESVGTTSGNITPLRTAS